MSEDKIIIEKLSPRAVTPKLATDQSVGYDFYATETVIIGVGKIVQVGTGIKMKLPSSKWMKLHTRSSHALIALSVEGGVIDSDYRGEIAFILKNTSLAREVIIVEGERIGQGTLHEAIRMSVEEGEVKEDETARGSGGFGSTGKW